MLAFSFENEREIDGRGITEQGMMISCVNRMTC